MSAVATRTTRNFIKQIFQKKQLEKTVTLEAYAERFNEDAELQEAFRRFSAQVQKLDAEAKKPVRIPKIDWEFYEKNIRAPGVVASIKKAYNELAKTKVPEPNEEALWEGYLGELEAAYENAISFNKVLDKSIADADAEIAAIDAQIARLDTITVEDTLHGNPELVDEVIDDIKHNRWDVDEFETLESLVAAEEKRAKGEVHEAHH
jgi:hypothetical protein